MRTTALPIHALPGYLIRRCHQISLGIFHDACGDLDLTQIQYAALVGIRARPDIDQITLAGTIGVDRSTIGNVLTRMEGRGWITRRPDTKDRRLRRLTITAEGEALLEAAAERIVQVQERLMAPLDAAEQAAFLRLLGRIVDGNNDESRAPMASPE